MTVFTLYYKTGLPGYPRILTAMTPKRPSVYLRITLSSEDELEGFYEYESFEVIELVVQDTLAPDNTGTWVRA